MLPVESGTILRLLIFSAFIGFVLFCASYATHVWLKRNKGNLHGGSWPYRVGAGLIVAGVLGLGGSWALNRFVDRGGIVDGGGLFVVHARQDGHAVMTARPSVEQGEVVATFHPPAFADQIRVIDSRVAEAQARTAAHRARPLEIDGALLQRHEQLRVQQAQQMQFREEFDRARRELERGRIDATTQLERERGQVMGEVAVVQTALAGVQQQLAVATGRLGRSGRLRRQGLTTVHAHDEHIAAVVRLELERNRLETAARGLAARLDLVAQQHGRAKAAFAAQAVELEGKAIAAAQALAELGPALADAASRVEQDRTRAAARLASEVEMAERQVETLLAERARVVASHQVVAPFAGRVVYRAGSPGLAPGGAAIMALSAGTGFVANIVIPQGEIESLAGAGRVMFALDHPVLKKYFPGEFRAVEPTSYEPGRVVATFDAQLPQDAIGLLGIGREAVKVRLLWQPPLLDSGHFRTSLAVLLLGVLLMLSGHLRGLLRLPSGDFGQRKA